MSTWNPKANEIFLHALELPTPGEREDYLDRACQSDAALKVEVEALLKGRTGIGPAIVQALDEWAAMRKRNRGDHDAGWKNLLEVSRLADADDWRNRCREALEKRDREMLERLAQSIPIQEAPPATVYLPGHTLADLGSVEKAAEVLRAGQRRHPDDFWLNDALGWISLFRLRPPRYDDALRYYAAALAVRPRSAPAHRALAGALFAKGATDDAMAQYAQAIELAPNDPENWNQRGRRYRSLGQFEKAVADLNKAIELEPRFANACNERAVAYIRLGEADKALADLNKAIEIEPRDSVQYFNRGCVYDAGGLLRQYDKAIADFSKAIELDPEFLDAWKSRGACHAKQGRWTLARADFEKVSELRPDDAEPWCNDACLLLLQGDTDGYREVCRQALARFSGSADSITLYLVARICHLAPARYPTLASR